MEQHEVKPQVWRYVCPHPQWTKNWRGTTIPNSDYTAWMAGHKACNDDLLPIIKGLLQISANYEVETEHKITDNEMALIGQAMETIGMEHEGKLLQEDAACHKRRT